MKRPIDKKLFGMRVALPAAATTNQTIYTTTFPGTVTGIRWDLSFCPTASVATGDGVWCIFILREGVNIPVVAQAAFGALTDGPEQNVLACGNWTHGLLNEIDIDRQIGMTKTQRKLMGGDTLGITFQSTGGGATLIKAILQFFIKS